MLIDNVNHSRLAPLVKGKKKKKKIFPSSPVRRGSFYPLTPPATANSSTRFFGYYKAGQSTVQHHNITTAQQHSFSFNCNCILGFFEQLVEFKIINSPSLSIHLANLASDIANGCYSLPSSKVSQHQRRVLRGTLHTTYLHTTYIPPVPAPII